MARQFSIELLDLVIDLADLAYHRTGARGERTAHHGRHLELWGSQRIADLGAAVDVALAGTSTKDARSRSMVSCAATRGSDAVARTPTA